jgi:hypothetical protein
MPIPEKKDNRLTLDLEGLVLNNDGTYVSYFANCILCVSLMIDFRLWISDEYGPYIYLFNSTGGIIQTIQPPDAIIPMTDGDIDFESENDPDTGRAGNKGKQNLSKACGVE